MARVIGISGKIGAGKDRLGDFLIEAIAERNGGARRYEKRAFATKLKQVCAVLCGTTLEEQQTHEGKQRYLDVWQMTVGRMQQLVGSEVMRAHFDADCWVKALFADYNAALAANVGWVITDCRFPNEIAAVRAHGGITVRIEGDPAGENARTTRDRTHPSETALDTVPVETWDEIVDNSRADSLDELRAKARAIVERHNLYSSLL
jgi:hypothetical protein